MPQNIFDVFWSNVNWHREIKGLNWKDLGGGSALAYRQRKANVTLKKIAEIAQVLGIDDYAILFEEVPIEE